MLIQLATLAASIALGAVGCSGATDTPEGTFAGDGRTQFTTNGTIQFNRIYNARNAPLNGTQCKWSIVKEPNGSLPGHDTVTVVKGTWGNAKIKVAKPDTVRVYLVSKDCGVWKP